VVLGIFVRNEPPEKLADSHLGALVVLGIFVRNEPPES
jgi:hypothetical protein